MANTTTIVFPKADYVTIKQVDKTPEGETVFLHTYTFQNKVVLTLKIWLRINTIGGNIMTKIEQTFFDQ